MAYEFRLNIVENVRTTVKSIRGEMGKTEKKANSFRQTVRNIVKPFKDLRKSIGQFNKQFRKIPITKFKKQFFQLRQQIEKTFAVRAISGFIVKVNQAKAKVQSLFKSLRSNEKGGGFGVGSMVKGNLIASGIEGMVGGAASSLMDIPQMAMRVAALNESIKFSGASEGMNNLAFLEGMIDKYNLPILEAKSSFSQLSGAFMDTKLAGSEMRNIFEGVSMAARSLNMDNEQMNGTFTALGQMMSKGKVSAEELNGQLGERLPGALGLAAKAMGMSKAELMKMMEEGKLMSEDFLPKFAAQLKTTFGEQSLKAADMLPAKIQRLQNSLDVLKMEAFKALEPLITVGVDVATDFIRGIGSVKKPIENIVNTVLTFIEPIAGELFQVGFSIYEGMLPIWETIRPMLMQLSQPIANIIRSLRGVFDILMPIVSEIVTTFLEAFNGTNALGGAFDMVAHVIDGVGQVLGFVFGLLRPLLRGLANLAGRVMRLFVKVGTTIGELLGKMLKGLFGALNRTFGLIDKVSKKLGGDGFEFRLKLPKLGTTKVDMGTMTDPDFKDGGQRPTRPALSNRALPTGSDQKKQRKQGLTAGIAGVKTDRRITNIQIKLDKLADITLHTTHVRESASKVKQVLQRSLLEVLNDANHMAMG